MGHLAHSLFYQVLAMLWGHDTTWITIVPASVKGSSTGTGPELVGRAHDCLGFNWGWHGIGAKCSAMRNYLDQVFGGGGEDPAVAPTLKSGTELVTTVTKVSRFVRPIGKRYRTGETRHSDAREG